MKPATHDGHCQVCDRLHRAPSCLMALHGYSVKWNQFLGTCWGSKELPFEKDNKLAVQSLKWAQDAYDSLVAQAAAVRAGTGGDWFHAYIPVSRNRDANYQWLKGRVVEVTLPKHSRSVRLWECAPRFAGDTVRNLDFETCRILNQHQGYERAESNERYAKELDLAAAMRVDYLKWQKARLNGWKVRPLPLRAE